MRNILLLEYDQMTPEMTLACRTIATFLGRGWHVEIDPVFGLLAIEHYDEEERYAGCYPQ